MPLVFVRGHFESSPASFPDVSLFSRDKSARSLHVLRALELPPSIRGISSLGVLILSPKFSLTSSLLGRSKRLRRKELPQLRGRSSEIARSRSIDSETGWSYLGGPASAAGNNFCRSFFPILRVAELIFAIVIDCFISRSLLCRGSTIEFHKKWQAPGGVGGGGVKGTKMQDKR